MLDCHCEHFGVVGLISEVARVRLSYGRHGKGPASVVVKIPRTGPAGGSVGQPGVYEREARFFAEVAPDVGVDVPGCLASHWDPGTGHFILVLEDLGHLRVGDQLSGISDDEALAVSRLLAQLHSYWWMHPRLDALGWLPTELDEVGRLTEGADYRLLAEQWGDVLGSERLQRARAILAAFPALVEDIDSTPRTLLHGDARGDNLLFGDDRIVMIDWQAALRGPSGARDLAQLCATTLDPDQRHRLLDPMIDLYLEAFRLGCGVELDAQRFREAMAVSAASVILLGARGIQLAITDERGHQIQAKMITGFHDLAHELDFLE